MNSIIPSNNSPLQHALAKLSERELLDLNTNLITNSKNADLCDVVWLVFLAWENSITDEEGWVFAKNNEVRRELIKSAYELHCHKGTPYAIKKMFRTLGYGEVRIHEGGGHKKHDATIKYRDGFHLRGSTERWAHYQIEFLDKPIKRSQIHYIKRCIQHYAPARCVLEGFKQARGTLKHNGHAQRNGQYSRGQVWLN